MKTIKKMAFLYCLTVIVSLCIKALIIYIVYNPPSFDYIKNFDLSKYYLPDVDIITDEVIDEPKEVSESIAKASYNNAASENKEKEVDVTSSSDSNIPTNALVYKAIDNYPVGYYYLQMSPENKGVYYVYDGTTTYRIEFYGVGSNMSPLFYLNEDSYFYTTDNSARVKLISA